MYTLRRYFLSRNVHEVICVTMEVLSKMLRLRREEPQCIYYKDNDVESFAKEAMFKQDLSSMDVKGAKRITGHTDISHMVDREL
jgi:hypothetical protein